MNRALPVNAQRTRHANITESKPQTNGLLGKNPIPRRRLRFASRSFRAFALPVGYSQRNIQSRLWAPKRPGPLRRLMRNCEEQRRSQDRMLMHQTLSKGWCHAGSRLLLGLIVRVGGRLVEAQALFGAAQSWTSSSAYRPRGHHPGNTRPVASLEKRARFLALCSGIPAPLLPEPLLPKPTQPEGALSGARIAQLPACNGPNALWCFGGLPCAGHYSHPGHCEGKSFSQGTVCWASHLRQVRLEDRVGLRVQGSTFGQPRGRDLRFWSGGGCLRREAHRGLSHHRGLSRCLPGRQGLYGRGVGAALDRSLWSTGGGHSQRQLQEGVGENRLS